MKTLKCICIVTMLLSSGLTTICQAQSKFKPKYIREDNKVFRELTNYASDNGWIFFRKNIVIKPEEFFSRFGNSIGLNGGYEMRSISDILDVKQIRHQKYQLYYKGILVEGIQYSLHSRDGRLETAHGRIIEDFNFDAENIIGKDKALEYALTHLKRSIKDFLDKEKLPEGRLIIAFSNEDETKESYHLAYSFDIKGGKSFSDNAKVYIDANTGLVIKSHPLAFACFEHKSPSPSKENINSPSLARIIPATKGNILTPDVGTFIPNYSRYLRGQSTLSFQIESHPKGYKLYANPGNNTQQPLQTKRDVNGVGLLGLAGWEEQVTPETTFALRDWGDTYQDATTTHWAAQKAYTYFLEKFARSGIDGQGSMPKFFVGTPVDNALWDPNGDLATLGISPTTGRVVATIDIIGHEYGHGISNKTAQFVFSNTETGSLNEAVSDIIGTALEKYLLPDGNDSWNWTTGEDAWFKRNMANPALSDPAQPDYYLGPRWDYSQSDPHINNGVINKWFYNICTGFNYNGQQIAAIPFDDAMQIVYYALTHSYLNSTAQFSDMRLATLSAASNLFGECSPEQRRVDASWKAVGIGLSLPSCDADCDYSLSPSISYSNNNCNQQMTLTAACNSPGAGCNNVSYQFTGPNLSGNLSGSTVTVTAPSNGGNQLYSVKLVRSACYRDTRTFTVPINCGTTCDFSSGPRRVGTWGGGTNPLIVQIRAISGKNVLVTAINGSPNDKYYPRGDNFWGNVTQDPGVSNLQSCLNAGSTGWGGLEKPTGISPPSGYAEGTELDGAKYYQQAGADPCDFSSGPRDVGTWNMLTVQIRQYGTKKVLVTAIPGSAGDKHYPRGDNFWDNFTPYSGVAGLQTCLNGGQTGWWGLVNPNDVYPLSGYYQGEELDRAVYFQRNGYRKAAPQETQAELSLVKLRPNPTHDELTVSIELTSAGDVPIRLLDLQGRVQQSLVLKGVAGKNEQVLKMSSLNAGMYMVEVIIGGQQRIVQKVLKQ